MREQRPLFESTALEGPVEARAVDGYDELNRLFRFEIHLRRPGTVTSSEEAAELLDAPASLRFMEDGDVLQQIHGVLCGVTAEADPESDTTDMILELVPRVWRLTQRRGSEIFLNVNVPEVIRRKLLEIGLEPEKDFVFALRDAYPVREIIAQYDETDHAFVSRLCEQHGIVTFFEHKDGREVWILTDTPATHHAIARAEIRVNRRRVHPAAWNVKTTLRRVPSQIRAHDYNYRAPLVDLNERRPIPRPAAGGEWIEYAPHSKTPADTARIATLRQEEIGARHHVVTAMTTEASVRAGGTFRLIDAAGNAEELLLVRVKHRFHKPEGDGAAAWENELSAIPSSVVFRPPRVTPWPRIPGLQNAIVDGAIRGDYAELDESGRYHLRMRSDLSGRTDLGATHPVRMMQPHAGANYGMHFPLRPGTEVLVGFVNGDPDRPIIIGSAPNPTTVSPVEQRNQTQNVLRTGSNNEMVIEDEHGTERIRIHTPHKNTTVQLGAVQEAEEGALTRTEASISEASRESNNLTTDRRTVIADTSSSLVGRSAVLAVGSPGITRGVARGLDQPSALSSDELTKDLDHLAKTPEKRAEEKKEKEEEAKDPTKQDVATTVPYSGTWSMVGQDVSERTRTSLSELVRVVSADTDDGLDRAQGRVQGEPLGQPLDPSAIIASERTAALVGREVGLVFGDRVAAVSSHDTASLMGRQTAQVKSPNRVEVAGAKEVKLSSSGTLDAQAALVRVVAGWYPTEAPPLDEGTTVGVLSKRDLRLTSTDDCILLCAKKNLIGTAHTGDIRLRAKKVASISAGSIIGTAGSITLKSSDTIDIDADGNITITSAANIGVEAAAELLLKGATVTIEGGSITLKGPTVVEGDLTVTGSINGG